MPFSKFAWPVRLLSVLVPVVLAGCSADRYFLVQKKDLSELQTRLASQQQSLDALQARLSDETGREQIASLHADLKQSLDSASQTLLQAIQTQVEKPVCPPVPVAPTCVTSLMPLERTRNELANEDRGRAEHLKGKLIVGEVEKFYLADPGLVFSARIDSGAETSSIDARNVERFERDGTNWVRFDVPDPNGKGLITLEREVARRVRVVQSNSEEFERRVVVELQFQIGDYRQQAEFTLTNRDHLSHSVLIGRNILRDVMLIDVGKEYATELPPTLLQPVVEEGE